MGETPHGRPTARTTATFVGGVVVVFGVLQVVQQVASAFDPRPVITASLTVGIALLGALVAHWQSRASAAKEQAQLHRLLAVHPDEQPGTADAIALGVFPGTRVRGRTPPYVSREIDASCEERSRRGPRSSSSVPRARASHGPRWKLCGGLRPTRRSSRPVGRTSSGPCWRRTRAWAVSRARRILWLDDLPQYVESLDQPALDRLPGYFPPPERAEHDELSVVATVREDEWLAMLAATGSAGQLARGLADRAEVYRLTPSRPRLRSPGGLHLPECRLPARSWRRAGELGHGGGDARAAPRRRSCRRTRDVGTGRRRSSRRRGDRWDRHCRRPRRLGVSTPTPPPMAAQDRGDRAPRGQGRPLRATGGGRSARPPRQRAGLTTLRRQRLRGAARRARPSDELRIYDEQDGWLRRAFRFRPAEPGVKFEFRGARDIDGDGAVEVVGGYAAPDARNAVLPLAIEWQGFAQRYAIVPLDLGPPPLSTAKLPERFQVQARLYRKKYARPSRSATRRVRGTSPATRPGVRDRDTAPVSSLPISSALRSTSRRIGALRASCRDPRGRSQPEPDPMPARASRDRRWRSCSRSARSDTPSPKRGNARRRTGTAASPAASGDRPSTRVEPVGSAW